VRLFFSFHRGRRWVPGDLLNFFYFFLLLNNKVLFLL
jgi:hypothetical protein